MKICRKYISIAESLDIAEEIGDPRAIATAQLNLGAVAFASAQYAGARRQFGIALETFRKIGSLLEGSVALTRIAQIAIVQGRHGEAVDDLLDAVQIALNIRSTPAGFRTKTLA